MTQAPRYSYTLRDYLDVEDAFDRCRLDLNELYVAAGGVKV